MQYGIFAAYHLALETSFLADEGATIPELPLKTPITVALPDKRSSVERSISMVPGFVSNVSKTLPENAVRSFRQQRSESSPYPGHKSSDGSIASPSSCSHVDFSSTEPSPQFRDSPGLTNQNHVRIVDGFLSQYCPSATSLREQLSEACHEHAPFYVSKGLAGNGEHGELFKLQDFALSVDEMSEGQPQGSYIECMNASNNEHIEVTKADMDEKQVVGSRLHHPIGTLSDKENCLHDECAPLKEEFPLSPSDHQSILVSLSIRCVWKGTVCSPAHMLRIKYYGSFDKPLGRFLRDDLLDQGFECNSCQRPTEAHVHCYTHRQGSLTISVKKLPEFMLPGEREGKIWMWHRCLKCPRNNGFPPATRRIVMSDAAWGLSFGKFLELSFSNHAAASRVASCGHSLHRDCLRFYGFGRMVACFRYASIDVHSVYLPPAKLNFDYQLQKWVEEEANEVLSKGGVFFAEVLNSLSLFSDKVSVVGSSPNVTKVSELRRQIAKLEELLQKEKGEFEDLLQKALAKELRKGQPAADILEINKLMRQFIFHSYVWDNRLNISDAFSRSGLAEDLNNIRDITKEPPSLMEKFIDANSALKEHGSPTPTDSSMPKEKIDGACKNGCDEVNNQGNFTELPNSLVTNIDGQEVEETSVILNEKIEDLTSGMNIKEQVDPCEAGIVVRRALSEGSFPVNDILDVACTGENHLGVLLHQELEALAPDYSMIDCEEQLALSQEKIAPDTIKFASTAFSKMDNEHGEDLGSWFEEPNFYQANGSKPCSNGARFGVHDFNPTYLPTCRDPDNQGGARLLLPVGVNDTVVPVYDDEPTSAVAYALASHDYHIQLFDDKENMREGSDSFFSLPFSDVTTSHSLQSLEEVSTESFRSFGSLDDGASTVSGSKSLSFDPVTYTKTMHTKLSFTDEGPLGKVKYTVICYYAKRFDALRQICCPIEMDYIRSISRCKKWGAQGGKSNVFFAKTLDDKFIIKQVTKTELDSFIKFAPEYFKYLSEAIGTGSPTCLAKILGIYQVSSKHLKGGKDTKMDFMIMEHLLYKRNATRVYDLKGSSRARYNDDSSGKNKVLLDQNLIESMPTSPFFVGNKAKRLLERAIWNDTSFLASIDVMDYSLLVGVDEENHELVVGIIDYMRQYTWDKHLESWVKTAMFGHPREQLPTVISPQQYKKRFRKAMSTYFLMVPDQWSPPSVVPSGSQSNLCDDNSQRPSVE